MSETWRAKAISGEPAQQATPDAVQPTAGPSPQGWRAKAVDPSNQQIWKGDINQVPEQGTGFGGGFVSGMMTPEQRIPYFARQRFPDMPEEEAAKRYGIEQGQVYYTGDDGKRYLENASFGSKLGRGISESLPGVGGALGFMASGGPVSPITGAAGGALAAGGVAAGQRAIGDFISGQPSTMRSKGEAAVGEAALDMAGSGAGALIAKGINPKILKSLQGQTRAGAESLIRTARDRFGIDLSWAEASNVKNLLQRQQYLNRAEGSADILYEKYLARVPQIRDAVQGYIAGLSRSGAAGDAAADVIQASRASVDAAKLARTNATQSMYQAAYGAAPTVSAAPVRDALKSELANATGDYARLLRQTGRELGEDAAINTQRLHNIRKDIDVAMQGKLERYADLSPEARRNLQTVRSAIDDVLKAVPGFADADRRFQLMSEPVERLQRSTIGRMANSKNANMGTIADGLFNSKNIDPAAFKATRDQIIAQDPDAWNGLVKWHLSNQFDAATAKMRPDEVRDVGRKFVGAVYGSGSDKQAELMKLALEHDPDAKRSFETLMEVLNATGRAIGEGSPTQPLQAEARKAAAEAMSGSPAGRAAQAGRLVSLEAIPRAAQWVNDLMAGGYNARMAEALFDPNFQQAMATVRKQGPKTQAAIQTTMRLLLQGGDAATGASQQIGAGALNAAMPQAQQPGP